MSTPKSLPSSMIVLAYLGAGSALACSYFMLRQVLSMQAGIGSKMIGYLLPAALLFGAAVLARMAGHLHARGFVGALCLVVPCWLFLEGISVWTSYYSVQIGVEQHRIDEQRETAAYKAAEQSSRAAAAAAERLAFNLQNMPSRYITAGNNAAAQLNELLETQRQLVTAQQNAGGNAVSTVMGNDSSRQMWAMAIALGLSICVLALQFGLGVTSDGAQAQRENPLEITETKGGNSGPGNLRAVK